MHVTPVKQQLVLVGGGHSNVQVVRAFAMQPLADVSVVLISDQILAGYSGMLPGWIAGHFSREETHIDLARLCSVSGVTFINSRVTDINTEQQIIHCEGRPDVYYDFLSINTGSTPATLVSSDQQKNIIPIKPVEGFLNRLDRIVNSTQKKRTISIIGAGVAGVEVMFSILHRYQHRTDLQYQLITSKKQIVLQLNNSARKFLREKLKEKKVSTKTEFELEKVIDRQLVAVNGDQLQSDISILCTGGKPPKWLERVALEKDSEGFIQVDTNLVSVTHANIFAAGDVASMRDYQLEKSGVYAVRQGKLLAHNLRLALKNKPLKAYKPQRSFLKLISLGVESALAVKGPFAYAGKWVWRWKQRIDTEFVSRFNDFTMPMAKNLEVAEYDDQPMRCNGCAAKVSQSVLSDVLTGSAVNVMKDDAALVELEGDSSLLQSLDFFRALDKDLYLNTLVTLNHALNDSYAMGVTPHSVMSLIGLPAALNTLQKNQLTQIHEAINTGLKESGATLIGGHTAETAEVMLGFNVNAFSARRDAWSKQGMQANDVLILTKPLGSGVIFAAHGQGKVSGEVVANAFECLLQTNHKAVEILKQIDVHACTDITGFGFLGHLQEMLPDDGVKVAIHLNSLPMLEGAAPLLAAGIRSSLHDENRSSSQILVDDELLTSAEHAEILFDPQTAGGLMFSIDKAEAESILPLLVDSGYQAAIVGSVYASSDSSTVYLEGIVSTP